MSQDAELRELRKMKRVQRIVTVFAAIFFIALWVVILLGYKGALAIRYLIERQAITSQELLETINLLIICNGLAVFLLLFTTTAWSLVMRRVISGKDRRHSAS